MSNFIYISHKKLKNTDTDNFFSLKPRLDNHTDIDPQNTDTDTKNTDTDKTKHLCNIPPMPNLEAWQEINIPAWRRILRESIEAGDKDREAYARRMLKDVLKVEDSQ